MLQTALRMATLPKSSPNFGQSPGFCRDCLNEAKTRAGTCRTCGSPRLFFHDEWSGLPIAHIDCDAFYAAVEKRDKPELRDLPVMIGGGKRGVVSTACYIARISGVRSAMPMFKAKKLCPDAVVLPPDMQKYARVGRDIRRLMRELTPLVEPLSIDEAFLDLTGTARLHGKPPAISLAELTLKIEREIGITVSVGLSHNKFLAKIASDLDKPRGFAAIGAAETLTFLAGKPVSLIWGVGKATQKALAKHGITTIAQLQSMEKVDLMRNFSGIGARLYHLARGEDTRKVSNQGETKSISSETTFFDDVKDLPELERILWTLCEKVSYRAKKAGLAGQTVVLKLKTADFRTRTRNVSLGDPTHLADRIFAAARPMLAKQANGTRFRLIGIGISNLLAVDHDPALDDLDFNAAQRARAELAMDSLREKFGKGAVNLGRGLKSQRKD